METRKCPTCTRSFTPKPRAHTQRYCSQPCQLKAAQQARRSSTLTERPCETCGRVFRPKQIKAAGRFCSRRCLYVGTRREKAPNWRGGRYLNSHGYVKVYEPDHPQADSMGYISEHRLMMEEIVGRPLDRQESVHHKNGDRADNRAENLQLRQGRHGKGASFICGDCGSHNVRSVAL